MSLRVVISKQERNGFKYLICHFWDGIQFSGQEYFSHLPIPRESPVLERGIFGCLRQLNSVSYAKFIPQINASSPKIFITVLKNKDLNIVQQDVVDILQQILKSFFVNVEVNSE